MVESLSMIRLYLMVHFGLWPADVPGAVKTACCWVPRPSLCQFLYWEKSYLTVGDRQVQVGVAAECQLSEPEVQYLTAD